MARRRVGVGVRGVSEDRGEFWSWPWGKVPHRIGIGAKVGVAGRASRGWSRSLEGLPLDGRRRSWLYGC